MMVPAYRGAVADESGVQDHLGLHGEFRASQLQDILSQKASKKMP